MRRGIKHSFRAVFATLCVVGIAALAACGRHSTGQGTGQGDVSQASDAERVVFRLEELLRLTTPVSSMTWSPDGRYIATVSSDGLSSSPIVVWDLTTGTHILEIRNEKPIAALAWSPDGETIASASDTRDNNAIVDLYDAQTGQRTNTFMGFAPQVGRPTNLQFSTDGSTIAVTVSANQMRLLDAQTGEERYQDSGAPHRFVNGIAWSPDGTMFASTDAELEYSTNALGLYDAKTGNLIEYLAGAMSDYRGDILWSPDGSMLAVVLVKIDLYDVNARQRLRTIDSDVVSASWSFDGRILASSDAGRGSGYIPEGADVIRLWDAAAGRDLRNLSDEFGLRGRVTWSPVGYKLAVEARPLVILGVQQGGPTDDATKEAAQPTRHGQMTTGSSAGQTGTVATSETSATDPDMLLNQLKSATSLSIEDTWSPMGDQSTKSTHAMYRLTRKDGEFVGSVTFTAYGEQNAKSVVVEEISIPAEAAGAFLAKLGETPLEEGRYEPAQETSDFVVIDVELQVNRRTVLFDSASDTEGRVPWRVSLQGNSYVSNSPVPHDALRILTPHLRGEVLDEMLKELGVSR